MNSFPNLFDFLWAMKYFFLFQTGSAALSLFLAQRNRYGLSFVMLFIQPMCWLFLVFYYGRRFFGWADGVFEYMMANYTLRFFEVLTLSIVIGTVTIIFVTLSIWSSILKDKK